MSVKSRVRYCNTSLEYREHGRMGICRSNKDCNLHASSPFDKRTRQIERCFTSRLSGFARVMTPVRGLTTKWSVSCMPYFTGDPSGSWPFRTNTSVPTLVDSESGRPVGYPPASRIGGSFTLLPAGTTKKKRLFSRVSVVGYIDHGREIPSYVP